METCTARAGRCQGRRVMWRGYAWTLKVGSAKRGEKALQQRRAGRSPPKEQPHSLTGARSPNQESHLQSSPEGTVPSVLDQCVPVKGWWVRKTTKPKCQDVVLARLTKPLAEAKEGSRVQRGRRGPRWWQRTRLEPHSDRGRALAGHWRQKSSPGKGRGGSPASPQREAGLILLPGPGRAGSPRVPSSGAGPVEEGSTQSPSVSSCSQQAWWAPPS